MSAKHTPGPWTVENATTGESSGAEVHFSDGFIAIVAGGNYGQFRVVDDGGEAEFLANARLIAAAPDLLAACEAFVAYDEGDEVDGVGLMLAYNRAIEAARAAIAKATS